MKRHQSITSLSLSPEQERHRRMVKYVLAMSIRMVCLLLLLVVDGWWLVLCAVGAIVLPYFAVVVANVGTTPRAPDAVRPTGTVALYRPDRGGSDTGAPTRSDDADAA